MEIPKINTIKSKSISPQPKNKRLKASRVKRIPFRSSAAAMDIDTKLVDDDEFTYDQFSNVWDKVIDLGGDD